jgi:hypothetical protein
VFSVIRSRGQAAAIRALGATTTDIWGPARQDAVGAGRVDGFEMHYKLWSLVIAPSAVPYVAANVNLWPETAVLLANPHRLSSLSDSQQRWLQQAAADAAARSTQLYSNEAPLVRALCRRRARFTDASAADLAALRRAFDPVYAHLADDATVKNLISRIEELKRQTRLEPTPAIPARCAGRSRVPSSQKGGQTNAGVLNGVYRITLTDPELRAAGPPAAFSRPSFGGLITLTLRNGTYRFRPRTPPACTGTYTVDGNRVRLRANPKTYCQGVVTARWSLVAGRLHLHVIASTDPYDQVVWGSKPWQRIG